MISYSSPMLFIFKYNTARSNFYALEAKTHRLSCVLCAVRDGLSWAHRAEDKGDRPPKHKCFSANHARYEASPSRLPAI